MSTSTYLITYIYKNFPLALVTNPRTLKHFKIRQKDDVNVHKTKQVKDS